MIAALLAVTGAAFLAAVLLGFWTIARVRAWADIAAAARAQLEAERAEVKRLTDVIIQMREKRMELGPEATDERWGRYVITDEAELAEERRRRAEAHDVDAFDDEVRRELSGF
jgi:hypothetical protein